MDANPKASRNCILALDAGGSKCDVVLADIDGHILGWGNSSVPGVGGRNFQAINQAVSGALAALVNKEFDALYVSAEGPVLPLNVFYSIKAKHCQIFACREETAALSHAGVDTGVVILAGTGAFVRAKLNNRRPVHFDGCGPLLGDFGGAYHIGTMALHAVIRSDWHPRHQTSLRQRVLSKLGVTQPPALFSLNLFNQDRSLVASLARFVIEESQAGDAVAAGILRQAAEALGETFRDLVTSQEIANESYTVIGTGGIIRRSQLYWDTLLGRIREIAPAFTPRRLIEPPVISVAIFALRRVLGTACEAAVQQLLQETQTHLSKAK